ncbi:hypothetical protein WJX84_000573 [Apatococcus fuscideae]|uniref:Uncharacterized protein n=1 Tax=Apatococcus fuscideae TaxID=2026836 RepID=A0AAW1S7A3_9CHLO
MPGFFTSRICKLMEAYLIWTSHSSGRASTCSELQESKLRPVSSYQVLLWLLYCATLADPGTGSKPKNYDKSMTMQSKFDLALQQGGVLVVDSRKTLAYFHSEQGPGDVAPIQDVISACCSH